MPLWGHEDNDGQISRWTDRPGKGDNEAWVWVVNMQREEKPVVVKDRTGLRVHQTWGAWRTSKGDYKWQLDARWGTDTRWRAEVVAILHEWG